MLPEIIRRKIEEKFGRPIRYSSDVDELCRKVQADTGNSISLNTMKRLLGLVTDVKEPRLYTLDIIAKFLGSETWDALLANGQEKSNSDFDSIEEITSSDLKGGDVLRFSYPPDRVVTCRYAGEESRFDVTESVNSKLRVGDVIWVSHFIKSYPLIVDNVLRDGKSLGQLVLGRYSGLTECKLIES